MLLSLITAKYARQAASRPTVRTIGGYPDGKRCKAQPGMGRLNCTCAEGVFKFTHLDQPQPVGRFYPKRGATQEKFFRGRNVLDDINAWIGSVLGR